ncbi:MAG: hypothetical protein IPM21_12625 [Acidobacteria bacterium]|nr:hypothetical protein [Acidobacteriota bacterium]
MKLFILIALLFFVRLEIETVGKTNSIDKKPEPSNELEHLEVHLDLRGGVSIVMKKIEFAFASNEP